MPAAGKGGVLRTGKAAASALALCVLGALAAPEASAAQKKFIRQLTRRVVLPPWARPTPNNPAPDRPWEPLNGARASARGMQRSTCKLLYLANTKAASPNHPFWLLKLGSCLVDLDQDGPAYYFLGRVTALPPQTPFNAKIRQPAGLGAAQRAARLLRARVLARYGLPDEARKEMRGVKLSTGYDSLLQAEVLMLMGELEEAAAALREACRLKTGAPEANWSETMVTLRAVSIARALGKDDLVREFSGPMLAKGKDSQKWPQWQASWSIVNKFAENAKAGPIAPSKALRSGSFAGSCDGFIGPITVRVTVASRKIRTVRVTKGREDRPWSALDVIPRRVVARQGLAVDAVTGATVTSTALLAAVDEAMLQASPGRAGRR